MDEIETYVSELILALTLLDLAAVRDVVDCLMDLWERDSTVFIIGNGGSAATASHMMNDLSKFTSIDGMPRMRAIALADNVPLLTAVANDIDFTDIFVEPLRCLLRPGDAVIAISASGNSPNVVKAAQYARKYGAIVMALCGKLGGQLAEVASHSVLIPADRIGQQEDGHLILNHAIACALRARIAAKRRAAPALVF